MPITLKRKGREQSSRLDVEQKDKEEEKVGDRNQRGRLQNRKNSSYLREK